MRNYFLILSTVLFFLACGNNPSTKDKEETDKINKTVLGVSLMDNRTQVIQEIEEQGYKYEESDLFITVKDKYFFSGFNFDKLDFVIFDAKVYMIMLIKDFDSEEAAKEQYNEIEKILKEKYSKYKTNETNDLYLLYTEFDDKETCLSLAIQYKPKEDVPPMFRDEETLHNAREHWELVMIYDVTKNLSFDDKKKDF